MPYLFPMRELKNNEAVEDGVKRIGKALIADARSILAGAEDKDFAVHEVRKLLKKLRALVRMVRDSLGEDAYKESNIAFRDAGRLLSDARDQYVLRQSLSELQERYKPYLKVRVFRPVANTLINRHRTEMKALRTGEPVFERVDRELTAMLDVVDQWTLPGAGFELLESSISRVYERGRTALEEALKDPDPEKFHEWRKRVKYLYYQFGYLQQLWPLRMGNTEEALSQLSDYLGKDHDFAVFAERLGDDEELAEDPVSRALLEQLLHHERMQIQEQAIPLGKRLYAEDPAAFTSRLRAYWKAMKEAQD